MAIITREEIDARFEASQARWEALHASLNGKLDVIVARLDSQSQRIDRLEQATSSLKNTVIITGVSSSIAISSAWLVSARHCYPI
jgi:hypothetical protein